MLTKFGELHTANVYYRGTDGTFKRRPVLIVDDSEEELIIIAEITSEGPNEPPKYFDKFKVEILDWKTAGLDKPSWVKCYIENVHRVLKDRVVKYIGVVEDSTMVSVLDKIYNV